MKLVLHPENETQLETHEDFLDAITWVEERLAPLYRVRRALRAEMAERFPPPELPPARYRTDAQQKVARCPRCGGKLAEPDGTTLAADLPDALPGEPDLSSDLVDGHPEG